LLSSPGPTPQLGPLLTIGGRTTSICNERLSQKQMVIGEQVFRNFVEDTVKALIDLENDRRGDQSSSLQVFCRVDVGVLFRWGTPSYYVSELERSLTTGLMQHLHVNMIWTMLDSAILKIPSYICNSAGEGVS
jgi:hypothetical protein